MSFSNMNCCVPQCSARKSKDEDVTFHRFPANIQLKKKWVSLLRIGKKLSPRMTVCSKHFQHTDFFLPGPKNKRRNLKRGVVPSKCLPISSVNLTTEDKVVAQRESGYMEISRIWSRNAGGNDGDTMEDTIYSETQDQEGSDGKCNRYQPYIDRISVPNYVNSATPGKRPKVIDTDIQKPEDEVENKFSLFGDLVANQLGQLPLHKALQCQCEIMKILTLHQMEVSCSSAEQPHNETPSMLNHKTECNI